MSAMLDAESTLTDRYQTTLPKLVRHALGLAKRDKIRYSIRPSGEVVLTRADASEGDDPAFRPLLDYLTRDIATRPERLKPLSAGLVRRLRSLTRSATIDLDAPLPADED